MLSAGASRPNNFVTGFAKAVRGCLGAEDADGRKSELNPLDAELAGRVCLDSNVLDK